MSKGFSGGLVATAVLVHGAWSSPADWRWVAACLQPVRGALVLIRHMINVGGHRVWSTQSVSPSQPT